MGYLVYKKTLLKKAHRIERRRSLQAVFDTRGVILQHAAHPMKALSQTYTETTCSGAEKGCWEALFTNCKA